jgi:hypothetical protein
LNQFSISHISNIYEKLISDKDENIDIINEDINKKSIDWNKEMEINDEIINLYEKQKKDINLNQKKSIFITGATKFLGSVLTNEILNNYNDYKIYCLVRGENKQNSIENFINDMKKALIWNDNYLNRIESFFF